MTPFSLFDHKSTYGGIYIVFLLNRITTVFFILIMPTTLAKPYVIWVMVAVGLISQLNLLLLSKWFSSAYAAKGYQGFVQLFGERLVRIFAFIGLLLILLKIIVITLAYVDIVHQFSFPSMNNNWLILVVLIISYYIAVQGMQKTIRFVVVAFIGSIWMLFLLFSFFLPPIASVRDLLPLVPSEWTLHSWKVLLLLWASFSGAEYLIGLVPWLDPKQKAFKYMSIANLLALVEYLIVFVAALFFFGWHYLGKVKFPLVNMMRYLQSPVLERLDIILISVHMLHFIYIIAIFLLYFYGAIRIVWGNVGKDTTRKGFVLSWLTLLACMILTNELYWKTEAERNFSMNLEMLSEAITYLLVPVILLIAMKRKGRVKG